MEKVFIVFGYNNIRLYDVQKIQKIAKEQYNAKIMLCREIITEQDKENMDYTCLVDLTKQDNDSLTEQSQAIINYAKTNNLQIIGCLPFSDKGVQLGSLVAKSLNLFHDKFGEESLACISKFAFRQLEQKSSLPSWYKTVDCKMVYSKQDLLDFFATYPKFFLKPNAEGGSRGCMAIESEADLNYWLDNFSTFLKEGALCEEYIENICEYSYDRIGNYEWVTEKFTTKGQFRAEPNHSAPAPLANPQYALLLEGGRLVSDLVGSNGGPCHMELFLTIEGKVACVEPNRRPAGANVFEIGSILYNNLTSSWAEWLKIASSGVINKESASIKPNTYVVNRFISPTSSYVAGDINVQELENLILKEYPNNLVSLNLSVKAGDKISAKIIDNSSFLGMFLIKGTDYTATNNLANNIENMVLNYVQRSKK